MVYVFVIRHHTCRIITTCMMSYHVAHYDNKGLYCDINMSYYTT